MKTKLKSLALSGLLTTVALFGIGSAYAIDKAQYAADVMDILRMHVYLLEQLAVTERFKYSDNVVRHATAIERTFGLLGPMEWHAAESARLHSKLIGNGTDLNEQMFEDLARASRKSLKELVRAAHDSMEEYDGNGVLSAVNSMKESCNNCHRRLPEQVAPDLWGPLERQ